MNLRLQPSIISRIIKGMDPQHLEQKKFQDFHMAHNQMCKDIKVSKQSSKDPKVKDNPSFNNGRPRRCLFQKKECPI